MDFTRHGVRCRVRLLILVTLLGVVACSGGGDGNPPELKRIRTITPGMGVSVSQVSFWDPQMPIDDTSWGRLEVDPGQLEKDTGLRRGWLNVATQYGWAVVNLPVEAGDGGPFAIYFDLGLAQQEPIQQIGLHVRYSDEAFEAIDDHLDKSTPFPVDAIVIAERGLGPDVFFDPGMPPVARSIRERLVLPELITTYTQTTTNAQCAQNQCAPMASANAFQYLENMGVWTVPHAHGMGLGGDTTLVGQLDDLSGRVFASRSVGSGVQVEDIVDACLEYIAAHAMAAGMTFRHQDEGWASALPAANYVAHGLTSQYDGGVPTFAWLWDRIRLGCAVTAGYSHSSGGHMVRVTGVKRDDAGNNWMRYTHDAVQTGSDPGDAIGLETVWVQLSDLDGDGILNLGAVARELRVVWAACP